MLGAASVINTDRNQGSKLASEAGTAADWRQFLSSAGRSTVARRSEVAFKRCHIDPRAETASR